MAFFAEKLRAAFNIFFSKIYKQTFICTRRFNKSLTNGFVELWPWGYKTFFMLNSVEHEILNAHKYKNIKKFGFF